MTQVFDFVSFFWGKSGKKDLSVKSKHRRTGIKLVGGVFLFKERVLAGGMANRVQGCQIPL
jgi:hypothetical protein